MRAFRLLAADSPLASSGRHIPAATPALWDSLHSAWPAPLPPPTNPPATSRARAEYSGTLQNGAGAVPVRSQHQWLIQVPSPADLLTLARPYQETSSYFMQACRKLIYRPAGEVINAREYEIAETRSDRIVKEFIAQHHYLQTTPPARFRFCLYKGEQLVGVAVFAHPTNDRTITDMFGCAAKEGGELSRLVLLDEVPENGESFFKKNPETKNVRSWFVRAESIRKLDRAEKAVEDAGVDDVPF